MKKAKKVKRQPYYCEVRGSWIIPLTRGRDTLVDAEDVKMLSNYNWRFSPQSNSTGRAISSIGKLMHRMIMNPPDILVIDHINGNPLDNRKKNLRICTHRENMQNKHIHRHGKLYGGYFRKDISKWAAQININKKNIPLGYFKTEYEAHQAYMKAYNELVTKGKSAA